MENLLLISITNEENNVLMCIPTVKKIKDCVWSFHPFKALGPHNDPLLFYLFLLCLEVLSKLIAKEEEKGLFYSVKIFREANPLTHLFYIDNLLVFCKAKEEEASIF